MSTQAAAASGEANVSSAKSSRSLRSCTDFVHGCDRSRGLEATGVALRGVTSPLLAFFAGGARDDAPLLASGVPKPASKQP